MMATVHLIPSSEIKFHPLSFGDENGRAFWWRGELYRGIKKPKADFYKELLRSAPIQTMIRDGLLVSTEITNLQTAGFDLVLKHKTIPIISYAYEWSFDALKDAALMILSVQEELSKAGLALHDAHPWNVLFDGSRPVFIDFCSIEPATEGLWVAHHEFRRFFLNPLRLMAAGQGRAARWFLHDENDGVSDHEVSSILDGKLINGSKQQARRLLRPVRAAVRASVSQFRGSPKKESGSRTRTALKKTRRQIEALELPSKRTVWSEYYEKAFPPFVPSPEWTPKHQSVHQVLRDLKPGSVLDIGCNRGWYSLLAARTGSRVVAFDRDEPCINFLYSQAKLDNLSMHPLVMNFLNPSGGDGLNNQWFPPATQRLKSQMVFALALTHHLVFAYRLNFEQIADALSAFSLNSLLVEFVPKEDHYVAEWWSQYFDWYTLDNFQGALQRRYTKIKTLPSMTPRTLLLCEK